MENIITEVKNKNDLVEVVGTYVQLKKAGRHFTGLCPFHQEKSPSFVVSPERQMWYCFGACHEGGDVISFMMKYENIPFYEALQELARRANIQITDNSFKDREWEKREVLYKINQAANGFFHHILHNTKFGARARDYLKDRGINEKIVQTFELGYAPESWESLFKFLKKKNFTEADIERTGLLVKSDRGSYYDRFRGRLMFPIKDNRDSIVGFSGRIMTDSKEAKYINIPETELYHKRESLYGIHRTKDEIRSTGQVLVVEGEFDVIGPFQHGVRNTVAIKGSSVTRDHLRILKRFAQKIILCLDSDAAGQDAVMRTIREAEEMEVEIYVMALPEGKDPDETVRTNLIEFKKAIDTVIPAYDFILEAIAKKHTGGSPFDKKKAVDELVPFLFFIKNPILLAHYVKHAAELFEVAEESLREVMTLYSRKQQNATFKKSGIEPKVVPAGPDESKQSYLLRYLFQQEDPLKDVTKIFTIIQPSDFTVPAHKKLAQALQTYQQTHETFLVSQFIASLPAELHPVFDEMYLHPITSDASIVDDVTPLAIHIKMDVIQLEMKRISQLQDSGAYDEEFQKLNKERGRLQSILDVRTGKR